MLKYKLMLYIIYYYISFIITNKIIAGHKIFALFSKCQQFVKLPSELYSLQLQVAGRIFQYV